MNLFLLSLNLYNELDESLCIHSEIVKTNGVFNKNDG